MLNRVAETMKKWPRHADPNLFHFQFLDPVLQLVQVENSPQCVHWALWTLSNLTKLFCKYVINIFYQFSFEYKVIKGIIYYKIITILDSDFTMVYFS